MVQKLFRTVESPAKAQKCENHSPISRLPRGPGVGAETERQNTRMHTDPVFAVSVKDPKAFIASLDLELKFQQIGEYANTKPVNDRTSCTSETS